MGFGAFSNSQIHQRHRGYLKNRYRSPLQIIYVANIFSVASANTKEPHYFLSGGGSEGGAVVAGSGFTGGLAWTRGGGEVAGSGVATVWTVGCELGAIPF